MTLRLSESQDELLTKIAQELNCSKHQAVIRALEAFDAKAQREKQIEYITKLVLERDKELLERLADA